MVLAADLAAPVPDGIALTDAVALPLALTTAAAGLFEPDQLGLPLPAHGVVEQHATVLVWGASTSVGSNAIQLARNSGYRVLATASPRNADRARGLGAAEVFDYRDPSAVPEIVRALRGERLAGTIAIGAGSLARTIRIARRSDGSRRVASAHPTPVTTVRAAAARPFGVRVSAIWGGTPATTGVGPALYRDFLPAALADGRYRTAPRAEVVGSDLAALPAALARLRRGVSARKLVLTLDETRSPDRASGSG